uniref:Anoctamin n=2 Tax=Hirondellea gigas TaxID=1518452 RepID=A0A6A7FSV7_9CRUS
MRTDSDDDRDSPEGPGASHIPPTIYVIKFNRNARRQAVEFLLERIESKQKFGGAELFVRCEPQTPGEGLVVHVSATKIKLLEIAEATELQKTTAEGLVQELSVRELDQFLHGGLTLETILTPAEREYCVRHELDGIVAREEQCVPGYPSLHFFPGQSVVDVYLAEELIVSMYPLHERCYLDEVASNWYKSIFLSAPLDKIRDYFGESIAMYFSFLSFYTMLLLVPAILGLAQMMLNIDSFSEYTFYAVFNLIWVTVFLEVWKRHCCGLAYRWGTLERDTGAGEMVRRNHRGELRRNPVTNRLEPHYPQWKTRAKLYLVSVPSVGLCVMAALYLMMMAFWAEEHIIDWKKHYGSIAGFFLNVPSAVYAAVVWLLNFYYRKLAAFLTEWENHRTQRDHDWHRMAKLVVFEFVNNFSSLFYIAFYIQDMDMLCSQVATMLIVTQMINHFQEALLPLVVRKAYNKFSSAVMEQLSQNPSLAPYVAPVPRPVYRDGVEAQPIPVLSLDHKDPRIQQAKEEGQMDPYTDTYDDYLEMFLQFGYVFLFSSVYPMAAFWALLNNVLELKTDAFKLCRVMQRPSVKKCSDIGVWQNCFELLGCIAVATNCALLCMSPKLRRAAPGFSTIEWVLMFVVLEHLILIGKMALMWLVPDQPAWVREALDKIAYHSKMALRSERGKRTRRQLSRRFRSVHGVPRSGSRSRGTTPVAATTAANGSVRRRDY